MIEIKKIKGYYNNAELWIDGLIEEQYEGGNRRYFCWAFEGVNELNVYDQILSEEILRYSPLELKFAELTKCTLRLASKQLDLFKGIPITHGWSKRHEIKVLWNIGPQTTPLCYFYFDFDFQNWSKPYSYQIYKEYLAIQIEKLVLNRKDTSFYLSSTINRSNDSVRFNLVKNKPLKDQISGFVEILRRANKLAFELLEKAFAQNTIKEFIFPPEVRTSCEQYLMFFADFLRDIGVSAVANIEHSKTGKTLFSVIPDNPKIALDSIREALEIYLELPVSPLVNDENVSDARMLTLRAEVNTLKARLDFAQIRQLEIEKRAGLQAKLITAQDEILREKENKIQSLEKRDHRHFAPSILNESVIEADYVDIEVDDGFANEKRGKVSNNEIDMGLVTVKPARIALGIEANTPRLLRLGIKTGKQLFDYLNERINSNDPKN
jgi:hypothetical protein